jgi:hypothetical protein
VRGNDHCLIFFCIYLLYLILSWVGCHLCGWLFHLRNTCLAGDSHHRQRLPLGAAHNEDSAGLGRGPRPLLHRTRRRGGGGRAKQVRRITIPPLLNVYMSVMNNARRPLINVDQAMSCRLSQRGSLCYLFMCRFERRARAILVTIVMSINIEC